MNKFYLTTAIHYANAAPHIGHAYEDVLADIIARYHRLRGERVWFLTGMDEHGSKILRAARQKGTSPQNFVDQNTEKFRDLFSKLSISYDDFIRTSNKERHWPGAIALWKALDKSGDLYKKSYRGLYCVGCENFTAERDLVNGMCPVHQINPEVIEEENYFFRLSKYADKIRSLIENKELKIYPETRMNEILSFIRSGLEDISFSRPETSIPWGIPVPDDPSQTMYVWCDALSNYISAAGFGRDNKSFSDLWPADLHIIGKDILRFHAALWPGMLLSAGLPLPKSILAHGFITSGGVKMSKSIGNVIDPSDIVARFGSETFRFFFAKEISPFEDGDFTENKLIESYNGYLANGLGNLVSRVTGMVSSYFGGSLKNINYELAPFMPVPGANSFSSWYGYSVPKIVINKIIHDYEKAFDAYEINRVCEIIWQFIGFLDTYIQNYEPWKLSKTDPEKTKHVLGNLCSGLVHLTDLIAPILPQTEKVLRELVKPEGKNSFNVTKPATTLFPRI